MCVRRPSEPDPSTTRNDVARGGFPLSSCLPPRRHVSKIRRGREAGFRRDPSRKARISWVQSHRWGVSSSAHVPRRLSSQGIDVGPFRRWSCTNPPRFDLVWFGTVRSERTGAGARAARARRRWEKRRSERRSWENPAVPTAPKRGSDAWLACRGRKKDEGNVDRGPWKTKGWRGSGRAWIRSNEPLPSRERPPSSCETGTNRCRVFRST